MRYQTAPCPAAPASYEGTPGPSIYDASDCRLSPRLTKPMCSFLTTVAFRLSKGVDSRQHNRFAIVVFTQMRGSIVKTNTSLARAIRLAIGGAAGLSAVFLSPVSMSQEAHRGSCRHRLANPPEPARTAAAGPDRQRRRLRRERRYVACRLHAETSDFRLRDQSHEQFVRQPRFSVGWRRHRRGRLGNRPSLSWRQSAFWSWSMAGAGSRVHRAPAFRARSTSIRFLQTP